MQNFPQAPKNIRSTGTEDIELRKLWNIPEAKYIWALYRKYITETCEMDGDEPNWDKIVKAEEEWGTQQGFLGDEEWAKKTAEHFNIPMPTEEYQGE